VISEAWNPFFHPSPFTNSPGIYIEQAPALDLIDHIFGNFHWKGRAPEAAPKSIAVGGYGSRAGILGPVHYNSTAACIVVYALLKSVEFKARAVAAEVFAGGAKKTGRGLIRFRLVGKPGRVEPARVFSVSYQKYLYLAGFHVDEKQAPAGRGLGVVYDGYEARVAEVGPIGPQELDGFEVSLIGQVPVPCRGAERKGPQNSPGKPVRPVTRPGIQNDENGRNQRDQAACSPAHISIPLPVSIFSNSTLMTPECQRGIRPGFVRLNYLYLIRVNPRLPAVWYE